MEEIWKPVVGAGAYTVSNLGNVRKHGRLKKQCKYSKGYMHTHINGKTKDVHTLVLPAFKPNPAPEFYDRIDHIDQNWDGSIRFG